MASPELDDAKAKLEIQKLRTEIIAELRIPEKKFKLLQIVIPALLTLFSILITALILMNSQFFEASSKLLEIKKESLNQQIKDNQHIIESLNGTIAKVTKSADSVDSVLNKATDSLDFTKKTLADKDKSLSEKDRDIRDGKITIALLRQKIEGDKVRSDLLQSELDLCYQNSGKASRPAGPPYEEFLRLANINKKYEGQLSANNGYKSDIKGLLIQLDPLPENPEKIKDILKQVSVKLDLIKN